MKVSGAEWIWAIVASVLVLLLSSLPAIAGHASQTPELVFNGAVYDRPDYSVHLASIQTGLRGSWQYPLLHTAENIPPAYVKTFYIAVGQAGRALPLSAGALYELARWLFGLWALLIMYSFAARFLWAVPMRCAAFLFFALGSGLGWIMLVAGWQPSPDVSPIDFWLIDLYGLFSLLVFPHFSAVFALLWTSVLAMLAHWQTGQWRWLIVSVMATVLAQAIQPFAPLIVDTALAGYAIWGWWRRRQIVPREFVALTALAIAQMPLLFYSAIVFQHPVWQSFSQQNITASPSPIYYLLGLGLPGALAGVGAWRLSRREWSEARVLLTWAMGVMILIYLPTQFQRRFTEAVMGPLSVLAATGLGNRLLPALRRWDGLKRWLARVGYPYRRMRGLIVVVIIVFSLQSSLYLIFGGALLAATHSPKLFDRREVIEAVDWLGEHSDWQDTVFASEQTGSLIPARIGHRVFLGHPIETAYYEAKTVGVEKFFSEALTEDDAKALLVECGCRFVFYGPAERAMGSFAPPSFLKAVFANDAVTVFEVTNGS